jgi:anthranilate synthase component 1
MSPWLTRYLLVGGGIVFDSDPYDEYIETINKLGANMTTLKTAEQKYSRMQSKERKVVVAK